MGTTCFYFTCMYPNSMGGNITTMITHTCIYFHICYFCYKTGKCKNSQKSETGKKGREREKKRKVSEGK